MSKYSDLLRDPRWQRKRLEVMQRAGFACEKCGDDKTTLNVHHRHYLPGRMPWEYPDDVFFCWCEPCHEAYHFPPPPKPAFDPNDPASLDPRERELLELLLLHDDLWQEVVPELPTELGRATLDAVRAKQTSTLIELLIDRAKRKDAKALLPPKDRMAAAIARLMPPEPEPEWDAMKDLSSDEEKAILQAFARAKLKQMGIIPSDV